MARYRTKPKVVEAIQWGGFNKQIEHPEVRWYDPYGDVQGICKECGKSYEEHGYIKNNDELLIVCVGDYIVEDSEGNFFIYKPKEFESKFELLND